MSEDFKKLTVKEKFEVLKLTIKYWLNGDKWDFAMEYSIALVKGWKK
jgi:predicted AlkP superfamily phosphohydrolase/phosphomutase